MIATMGLGILAHDERTWTFACSLLVRFARALYDTISDIGGFWIDHMLIYYVYLNS